MRVEFNALHATIPDFFADIDEADSLTSVVRAPNHDSDGDTTPPKERWWKSNRGKKGRNTKAKGITLSGHDINAVQCYYVKLCFIYMQ